MGDHNLHIAVMRNGMTTVDDTTIVSNYTLNINKALQRKLEAAKREVNLEYTYTNGGIVIKADAATFELIKMATLEYYGQLQPTTGTASFHRVTDKGGTAVVQNTIKVHLHDGKNYTINLYVTTCTLLVNGKNTEIFVNTDVRAIHDMISNTYCDNNRINIVKLNELMRRKLEEAVNKKDQESNMTDTNSNIDCIKCRRACRSRSTYCNTGNHWVHYRCQKLSPMEIEEAEADELGHYTCKLCKPTHDTNGTNTNAQISINGTTYDSDRNHGALSLLNEISEIRTDETPELNNEICTVCSHEIKQVEEQDCCDMCNSIAHRECLQHGNDGINCYSCTEAIQRLTEEELHSTDLKEPDNTVVKIPEKSQQRPISTKHQHHNVVTTEHNHSRTSGNEKNNSKATEYISTTQKDSMDATSKLKDIREREIKLRKAEELLKMKEKTIKQEEARLVLLESRCHYLEARNLELEALTNTLKRRMEQITDQRDKAPVEQLSHISTERCQDKPFINTNFSDKITNRIGAMHDKILNIVMEQVEEQLDVVANTLKKTPSNLTSETQNQPTPMNTYHPPPYQNNQGTSTQAAGPTNCHNTTRNGVWVGQPPINNNMQATAQLPVMVTAMPTALQSNFNINKIPNTNTSSMVTAIPTIIHNYGSSNRMSETNRLTAQQHSTAIHNGHVEPRIMYTTQTTRQDFRVPSTRRHVSHSHAKQDTERKHVTVQDRKYIRRPETRIEPAQHTIRNTVENNNHFLCNKSLKQQIR